MAASNRLLGKIAEQEACRFLLNKGLTLVKENFLCRLGEIDLIMKDKEHIVFVEVRMRKPNHYGSAFESITRSKQLKVVRTAIYYLQKNKLYNKVPCRFDAISIRPLAKGTNDIVWIKNAFSNTDF